MNKLASTVYDKFDGSQRNAAELVDTVLTTMKNTMVAGESINLVQCVTLNGSNKSTRRGRNPRTGDPQDYRHAADGVIPLEQATT